MQRVRIGITGLAVVFLLVLLTAALLGALRRQSPQPPTAVATIGNTQDTPKEPLAELGVAPGATPTASGPPTPVAAPAPTPLLSPAAPKVGGRSMRTGE